MLVVETIGRIRREHLVKGKSIKEIARDLKVSRNTVRKVLRSGETSFSYQREVQPRPKIGQWKAELDGLLAKNAVAEVRERLTLIRLFEELRALGYGGGYDAVRRYARIWSRNSTRGRRRRRMCRCHSHRAKPTCNRRSKNPSLKWPGRPVAPE
jgi:transposase-like protein